MFSASNAATGGLTASDLHTPLRKRQSLVKKLAAQLPALLSAFTRFGGLFLVLLGLGVTAWIVATNDPLGGEPIVAVQVHVAVDPAPQANADGQTPRLASETLPQPLPEPVSEPRVLQIEQPQSVDTAAQDAPPPPRLDPAGDLVRPQFDGRGGLSAAANPMLVERFDGQSLIPVRGPRGERALDAYARPVEAGTIAPDQPRIAIIVGGLGLSQTSTQAVIDSLPPQTTLAFAPYGNSLSRWTTRARQEGHEYLIEVPMEPFDFPNNDPGPHTLQVGFEPTANIERMHWALSRATTPVGIMNYMGARFTSEPQAIEPVLADALGRGLMVVDDARSARSRMLDVSGADTPAIKADVVIDARADQAAINNRLAQLETMARERGQAVGVATALPLTISTLADWMESLQDKGIALVPVTNLVRQ